MMIIQTLKILLYAEDLECFAKKYIPEDSKISDLEFSFCKDAIKIKGKCTMPLIGKMPLNLSVTASIQNPYELNLNVDFMGMGVGVSGLIMSFLDKKLVNIAAINRNGNNLIISIKKIIEGQNISANAKLNSVKIDQGIVLEMEAEVDLKKTFRI